MTVENEPHSILHVWYQNGTLYLQQEGTREEDAIKINPTVENLAELLHEIAEAILVG